MSTDQITLHVPGMTCGHCQAAVETELGKVAGVSAVAVDLATKLVTVTVTVTVDGAGADLSYPALVAAVDEAGFEVAEA